MASVTLNDLTLYYEAHGSGAPLILISGYAADHLFWVSLMPYLARHYQVILFDNRGVGQTKDAGAPFTIDDLADDVIQLCHYLGLKQPHVVGQSMGGMIAQRIAIRDPNLIGKLVILNSTAKLNYAGILALESSLALRRLDTPIDALIDAILPWLFSSDYLSKPNNIQNFKKAVIANPYPQSIEDQARQLEALKTFHSIADLHRIHAKTLVIASSEDVLIPSALSDYLASHLMHGYFELIPGGHASPIEQPVRLFNLITHFLAQ